MAFNPPSNPSNPSGPPTPRPPRSPSGSGGGIIRGRQTPPSKDEHRINERIRVPQVRLVDEKGNQVGVVATSEALKMARERNLDLMEVAPNASPPVCKICDYGKFKYEKKKKEQAAKKKQTVIKVKEIQLRPNTEEHDLDYKFKNVRTFLEDGDKAKITMMFRGREIAHSEGGYKVMEQLAELVKDVGVIESSPRMDGRKLIMVLAPIGSAGPKKPASIPGKIIPNS